MSRSFDEKPATDQEITPSRDEHLAWCKQRAREHLSVGNRGEALASMVSDLAKHPGTANHIGIHLGLMLLMSGHMDTLEETRKFIEGFN